MAEVPNEIKRFLFGRGAKWHARGASILCTLVLVFILIGIIGDAANRTPGLEPSNWFLLAIAVGVLGTWSWICSYFAAKEGYKP